MSEITEPLRLAVGSHAAGSGKGCAMNVISWESGDSTITDFPACADPFLARVVQQVNDTICEHRDGDLLCPACSLEVLNLGHRTVGTALNISDADRARVYVTIAVEAAESVLDKTTDPRPRQACALVRRFLAGEDITPAALRAAAREARYAAYAYAYADASASAYAAAAAAASSASAAAYASAASDAASAADADAAASAYAGVGGLARAHWVIDRFGELTGVKAGPTAPEITAEAYSKMTEAAHV